MSGYSFTQSLTECHMVKRGETFYIKREVMPNINIESFCISKNFNKVVMGSEKRCGGIVCYSFGSLSDAEEEHRPSQAFVSDSARIKKTAGDKGIIHGALCRIHLGYRLSEISKNKGVVI